MQFISEALTEYAEAHTTAESPLLYQLNRETHLKVLYARMLSGHLQGRVLALFSKLIQPKIIVEIGTFTGYAALCLAEGLTSDGKIHSIEIDPEIAAFAQRFFDKSEFKHQIILHLGNALEIIPQIPEPIDLVFLDADKKNYLNYYHLILPKMRIGALLIADNVLWSGKVIENQIEDEETTALRNFNKYIHQDQRVENVLLPFRDGLMCIRKIF
jgi:predicted O-methyltransferase YrrM